MNKIFPPENPSEGMIWSHRYNEKGQVIERLGESIPPGLIAVVGVPRLLPANNAIIGICSNLQNLQAGMVAYYKMIGCPAYKQKKNERL